MSQKRTLSWLSTVGDYDTLVHQLTASDPRLSRRDPKSKLRQKTPWVNAPARAVVLQAASNQPFRRPVVYTNASRLLESLCTDPPEGRRLVIMQGLNPAFVGAVGTCFRMHPSFFVEHERVVVVAHTTQTTESDAPVLVTGREHVTLKYYEAFELPDELMGMFKLCCADTGRHIGVTRLARSFSRIGVVRRKCAVWRRQREGGWDVVLITDPPLRRVQRDGPDDIVEITPVPMQGGYIDFLPHAIQTQARRGPPRTCMMDDVCFYLNASSSFIPTDEPASIQNLVLKIIASHYMQHADFLKTVVSNTQWHLANRENLESYSGSGVENQWRDVQALERRMAEYAHDLEWLMLQCRIPREGTSWEDVISDYQFIYSMYNDLRARVAALNGSITALAGMAGNRHALREAKSAKALTVVGLVFIPLAYVSSLFSMADDYMPGARLFWVYFAVSVPMIVVVFGVYLVIDLVLYGRVRP
ncbi:hypothetical protein ACJ41O_005873 [Fusarium nematophilum]